MQTLSQRREHFEIEHELRGRLLAETDAGRRRMLYGEVYAERTARISHHPLVAQSRDPAARAAAVSPQLRLLRGFVTASDIFVEIGAHDGAVAKAVAPYVKRSIALDVHDSMALAGERNYEFAVFDGFHIDLPDDSVDLVYSNDVVEHLHPDDMADQAGEILRVMRPGARYLCVTPNRLTGPHDVSRNFSQTPQGFHLREYTDTELVTCLMHAGFRRAQLVCSYHGVRLAPLLPPGIIRPVEAAFERIRPKSARRFGRPLATFKVMATA